MSESINWYAAWRHRMAFSTCPPCFVISHNSFLYIEATAATRRSRMSTTTLATVATEITSGTTESEKVSIEDTPRASESKILLQMAWPFIFIWSAY